MRTLLRSRCAVAKPPITLELIIIEMIANLQFINLAFSLDIFMFHGDLKHPLLSYEFS